MIHKVLVGRDVTPQELKKAFRKKLMTGGAVLELEPGLTEAELLELLKRFQIEAAPFGLQSEVLSLIVSQIRLTPELEIALLGLGLENVTRAVQATQQTKLQATPLQA